MQFSPSIGYATAGYPEKLARRLRIFNLTCFCASMMWLGFAARLDTMVEWGPVTLAEHGVADDPVVVDWFGNLVVDDYAMRLLGYRTLAKAGAQILTAPAAFTKPTGEAHWQVLLRARAIENQCFVAGVVSPPVVEGFESVHVYP